MSELEHHAQRIAELVEAIEQGPQRTPRDDVIELLAHVDHLHRTCVWRLFEQVMELGGKGLIERLAADPAVRTLFLLYDLIPPHAPVPVEANVPTAPPLSGGHPGDLVALAGSSRRAWRVAFDLDDVVPGTSAAVEVAGDPVLLAHTDEGVFAYRNVCPGSALPLHLMPIVDGQIRCPWHGCTFSAVTGERLDGPGADLAALGAEVRDGRLWVTPRRPGNSDGAADKGAPATETER